MTSSDRHVFELERDAVPRLERHQTAAVHRVERILDRHGGCLLADEPGLGKTYIAAAVCANRNRASLVECAVPASLMEYWRKVLDSFGIEAEIFSHDSIPIGTVPEASLLIVDEAHRFRSESTRRFGFLASRTVKADVLLVTATPVCNSVDDLRVLLGLIASDGALAGVGVDSINRVLGEGGALLDLTLSEFVVRHSINDIGDLNTGSVRESLVDFEPVESPDEIEALIRPLSFPWIDAGLGREVLRIFLRYRLESSLHAILGTVRRMKRVCKRALMLGERGLSLPAAALRNALGDPDAETFQDIMFPELWGASARDGFDKNEFRDELRRLDDLERRLDCSDTKVRKLESLVEERAGTPGVIFSVSYETALSVQSLLGSRWRTGLVSGRHCQIGSKRSRLADVVEALVRGELDIVVATDLGAEGLNLQTAGYVVHYDLPWNPAIVEQRNGRIRRIGQRREIVESIRFEARSSRAREILDTKIASTGEVQRAMGHVMSGGEVVPWCLPPILAPQSPQRGLLDLLCRRRRVTSGWLDRLSLRYRTGVERLIDAVLESGARGDDLEDLERVLERESARSPYNRTQWHSSS